MNEVKRLLSFVRRAVDDYKMIEDGDRIAIGISGGKDSLAMRRILTGTIVAFLAASTLFYLTCV